LPGGTDRLRRRRRAADVPRPAGAGRRAADRGASRGLHGHRGRPWVLPGDRQDRSPGGVHRDRVVRPARRARRAAAHRLEGPGGRLPRTHRAGATRMTTFDGSFRPGTFTPAPGRGSTWRMLRTHAKVETLLTLRHGEQILLTLLIPLALLIGMTVLDLVPADQLDDADPVGWTTPRILALAVMSSAFTGQAIALGFDRKYGVFKRLAATALPLWVLISGRIVAALCVATLQVLILGGVAAALGFRPVL